MEILTLDHDIKVFGITARSYPDGILEAHQKLHQLIPFTTDRKYFGISRPENGVIIYWAVAKEMNPGEADRLKCDSLVLKRGKYIGLTITDYMMDVPSIRKSFETLLLRPDLDPEGYCVEWYINAKDVKCMIRLSQQ